MLAILISIAGTVTITATDDGLFEGDEDIVLDVDSVTGALELGIQQVTVTIADDDPAALTLTFAQSPISEAAGCDETTTPRVPCALTGSPA